MDIKKIVFFGYCVLLICFTLLFFRGSPYGVVELNPIASYQRAANAPHHLAKIEIFGIVMNIAMFIPMGLLPPMIWKRLDKIYIILPIAFAATITIEFAQLLTGRGVFAIEDIMHNTIGAGIGYLAYKILKRYV